MSKIFFNNTTASSKQIITEENFQEVVLEIIENVIDKRKAIHLKYNNLIHRLQVSSKPLRVKTILGKYLLFRLIRESDRAFVEGQLLAKQLCPACAKKFDSYNNYSDKLH